MTQGKEDNTDKGQGQKATICYYFQIVFVWCMYTPNKNKALTIT